MHANKSQEFQVDDKQGNMELIRWTGEHANNCFAPRTIFVEFRNQTTKQKGWHSTNHAFGIHGRKAYILIQLIVSCNSQLHSVLSCPFPDPPTIMVLLSILFLVTTVPASYNTA